MNMQQGQLRIVATDRELTEMIVGCANRQEPFIALGKAYIISSLSRDMDSTGFWVDATMRQMPVRGWRGPEDGLPPVGLEVEVLYNSRPEVYVTCKVLAHDEDRAVYRFTSGPRKGEYQSDGQWFDVGSKRPLFRVIPTAEQLAEKERDDGINALCELMDGAGYRSAAERLYNAGVRAPEVK